MSTILTVETTTIVIKIGWFFTAQANPTLRVEVFELQLFSLTSPLLFIVELLLVVLTLIHLLMKLVDQGIFDQN